MKKTLTFYSLFFIAFLILQRGSGVLTKIVLTNSISPYDYGIITLVAVSLPAMFQLIVTLNFSQILSHSEKGRQYFGFSVIATIVLTLIVSVLLYIFSASFFQYMNLPPEQSGLFLLVIVISLLSTGILVDFQGLFTGLRDYSIPGILMALPTIIRLIMVIFLVLLNLASFEIIILVFALSNLIPLIFLCLSPHYRQCLSLVTTIQIPTKKIFAFGLALFIITSFSTFGQSLIKIVISHHLGILWQGYFDISLTLVSLLMFSLGTMSLITVPEATGSDNDTIHQEGGLGDVTRALFALTLLFIMILYFYSEFIVVLLFSKDFINAADYVVILGVGYVLLFIQNFVANLNISKAKNAIDYAVPALIPLICLPLFFFLPEQLIPYCAQLGFGNGFIGAYISFTAITLIVTCASILFSKDPSAVRIMGDKIGRLAAAALVTFCIITVLKPSPIPGLILMTLLFSLLVICTGYVKKELFLEIFHKEQA